jgi:hypothetical protein
MPIQHIVQKQIDAENQFSDWLIVQPESAFTLSIFGTFSATITTQITYDGGQTILDDTKFASPTNQISLKFPEEVKVRAGVLTGDFLSGIINIRLGRK